MRQKQKQKQRKDTEVEPDFQVATEDVTDVIEDAECCLSKIDEILEEVASENDWNAIYAKGHPDKWDDKWWDTRTGFNKTAWAEEHNRYAQAYEMLTGVVHQCGCGGCGSSITGYSGDGRGGGV